MIVGEGLGAESQRDEKEAAAHPGIIATVGIAVNVVPMAMGVWRRLAGEDSTARSGLPVHELLAPLPVISIALLIFNDRVFKGSAAPEWLTGKLSDVTGVFVFPLAATAVVDLIGYGLATLGVGWDYTLRRWKLAVAIGFTALVFGAAKLSPEVGALLQHAWGWLVPDAEIYPDPTDAIACVMLLATWWHGRRAIARGAYGRLAVARKRKLEHAYADAAACGADPAIVENLDRAVVAWAAGGPAEPVDAALASLR